MRAGDMDRRIAIEKRVLTTGPFNEQIVTFVLLADVWAEVKQQGGSEFLAAETVTAERRVVFRIRWLPGVSALDRVTHEGRAHNITETRELGRREGIELYTTALDEGV
jgi:SPP1 family predicted phage head-tail adaptor